MSAPERHRSGRPPSPALTARASRATSAALIVGLAAGGWGALLLWNASPHARFLDHDGLAEATLGHGTRLAVFLVGWVLMLLAMMLPSTYPMMVALQRVVAGRPRPGTRLAALVGGYLAVWAAVGWAAFAADLLLHGLQARLFGDALHGEATMAVVLCVAGGYQLSGSKDRCLQQCRSPRALVLAHWRGQRPLREALELGWRHGRTCVACCWALMLVMFAVGHGNLGWMLLLGGVMTAEKVLPWGRRLSVPTGLALLAAGTALLVAAVA
jgi:predicted metal-binding membrane protein